MKKGVRRARNKRGQYKADDPKTPNRNEAYENMSVIDGYNETKKKYGGLME